MSGNYLSMLKKRSWRKTLAVAVTAGILAGGYSTAMAANYSQTITGTSADTAYTSIIQPDNVYDFGAGGATIKPAKKALSVNIGAGVDNVTLKATGAELVFHSNSDDYRKGTVTFNKDGAGIVNIDAKKTIIRSYQDDYDGGSRAIVLNGESADKKAVLNVKGDLEVGVYSNGSDMTDTESEEVYGIFAKANSVVNVDGNYSMAPVPSSWGSVTEEETGLHFGYSERTDYSRIAAMYAGADSQINVKGNVNMTIKGSGLVAKGANSAITVGGGTMKMYDEAGWLSKKYLKNFYIAAAADGGKVNVNMNEAGNASGTNKTEMLGDVLASGAGSTLNIGLNTKDSKLSGVVRSENGGTANMYLGSGTWENKVFGNLTGFGGSVVENLVGGADADHRGVILQKDNNKLTVNNYSGHAMVFYDHTGNGTESIHYTGGDTLIKNAAAGSSIILSTGNNDITMDDEAQVNKVLATLAGKLTYEGFANKNLDAKVQIASGLTASSVAAKVGDITFGSNGKGEFVTAPPKPVEKVYNKQLTGIYGEDKANYSDVLTENNGQYNFGEGAKVTVETVNGLALYFDKNKGVHENLALNAANGSLTFKATADSQATDSTVAAKMTHAGNFTFNAADTNIIATAAKDSYAVTGLMVEGSDTHGQTAVNIKGNLNVNAKGSGATSYQPATGIMVKGDGVLTVDGNLVMKDEAGSWGVKDGDKSSYFATTGIKTDFDWNTNKGGIVNVKGLTDLVIDGSGVVVQQSGLVNLDGDVKIKTNKDSGKVAYSVAANSGGVVNVNMNADRDNAGDKTVTLEGNVGAISGFAPNATVNIGLSNEQSSLHGVVVNTTKGKNIGQVNLYVNNNALWTNESYGAVDRGFTGSNVGKFVGGSDASHAGFVLQKDSRPLTIGNYSGHTVLVYEHTGDGSEASHFAAGDTHIKNAAAGSGIVVSTDNNGIDTGNTELVNKVLNNLAGKLYYDAFATGEKNLNGVVQIASGLTGSSVSKVVGGDITFSEADGKGQYVTAPTIKTDFTTSITGVEGTDKEYVDGGIYKNGEYIFGQDSNINIATSDTASGITAKGNVVVKAEGSTLNINSKGKFGIDNTVGYSNKNNPYNVTITADKLNVSHENAAGRAEGIHILNSYSKNDQTDKVAKVVINGDTNINAYGVDYTIGAYVAGNSLLEINGNVAMKGQGDKQWGIDNDGTSSAGYHSISGLYAGATYGGNPAGGKIVVNGNVDLAVNGTGVLANGNGSSVVINGGGTILTNKDNKDVHYALAAENGSVSMNMNKDNTAAGTNKVDIKGNIGVLNGAVNDWDIVKDTTLNIGLSTADSVLTGVAVNNFTKEQLEAGNKPQLNMYVSNGATWNNEAYGKVVAGFAGSKVDKFVGGSDASKTGYIVQKDANALTIGNYSGHTVLVYEHTGDGSEASHFAAGDTHIKNAAAGSGIVVSTDNNGINTDNTELVNKVLNNLAGKLYYDAFATGEKNLNGVVQIASGLTGSSVSKVVGGDITFSEADGKGQYVTAPPKPVEHVFDKQIFEDMNESGPLDYWKTGNPYVSQGVKRTSRVIGQDEWGFDIYETQYNFVENSTINVDANKGDVIGSGSSSSQFGAIDVSSDGNVKVLMNDKKLTLNVNGVLSGYSRKTAGIKATSGNLTMDKVGGLDINVTNATFGGYGIWVQGDSGYTEGNAVVTINNGDTLDKAVKIHNNSSPLDAAIYVKNNSGKAALDIKGVVDIDVKGETDALYMNEGKMNIGGGSIVARGQGKAINAYHGTITVNAQYDQDGNIKAAEKALETDIYGNVKVYGNNKTAIGLNTAGSTFTGAIHTADNGRVDMILSDGALWTNKLTSTMNGFAGSTVNQLVGGATADKAGYILQSDSNRLNVNNYSGHTVIVYEHTGDGSDASHFAAGDTHIKKAAAGSSITMSTDNNGINTNDQELVNKVLNNLAGKLYYDAFVTGEKNLSGVVQIASGLTGSSISKVVSGDITFNDKTGQGQYGTTPVPPAPPEHQTEVNFSDAITGDKATDTVFVDSGVLKENGEYVFEKDSNITLTGANAALNAKQNVVIKAEGSTLNFVTNAGENAAQAIKNAAGKNINITADKTVVKVESTSGRVDGIYMSKGDITVNGALDVTAIGNGAQGIYANSGNHTFNGDVKITVDGKGGGWGHYGASGLYATSTMGDSKGSTITVNSMVDISGNGNGIYANAGGSSVTVQGGKIVVDDKNNKGYGAIRAENGVVNMNAKLDESGNLVGGNGKLVDITGNIVAGTGAVNPADKNGTKTAINLALDTKESKLHGLIINEFPAEGKPAGSLTFTGETNLLLQNGATWINESIKAEQAAKTLAAEGTGAQDSYVTNFIGGKDMASAGVIVQKDTNKLSIGNYSGHTYLVYEHTGDGTNATDFAAGDTHIKNAAVGSGITMVTDNTNGKIDVNNYDQVQKVLNNLAGKLYYDAYVTGEKNLTGKVQIASGLTGSAISQDLASGEMGFSETTGQGNVVGETIKPQPKPEPPIPGPGKPEGPQLPGNISNGDYETLMMYGARAAMVDSMVAWRDTTAESFVRADELHKGAEDGAWVRINRGKVDYSGAGTEINGNFYGVQTGFDKSMGDGWTAGLMFDYRDGDSDYKMGSEGEHKLYGMGIYGTKDLGSNDYIDVVAKFGKVENDFTARNETGKELSGEYSAAAYSMSAQYGKRFEDSNGGYFEPQAQLTWSHVNSDTYDAHCGDQVMNIDQTAFDSFVGRLGVQAGQITDNGQAYVRLSVAHEFAGDIDGVYLAKDGGLKTTQYNAGDTWSELNIGGSYKLSKCANFYADITKTLTGDYKQDWKFNAGMSFSF